MRHPDPVPVPPDFVLPGDWEGGDIVSVGDLYRRIFVNHSRMLVVDYLFWPVGPINLRSLSEAGPLFLDIEDAPPKVSYLAGAEFIAFDKAIVMMEKVENGMLDYC